MNVTNFLVRLYNSPDSLRLPDYISVEPPEPLTIMFPLPKSKYVHVEYTIWSLHIQQMVIIIIYN
jgi:hypothetical protein